ncbi:hypothetical protein GQ473_01285 [archaeon]|nr:hypothetical protein [archaeon]
MTFRNLILIGIFVIGIVLISGCIQNNETEKSEDKSITRCETFTIYQETDPTLLPVDTIEKAIKIKDNLPKCPNNQYQLGCVMENKEYEIKKLDYPAHSVSRVDKYGVPMIILYNGTVTWMRCVY